MSHKIKTRESCGVVIVQLSGKIAQGKGCEQVRELVNHLLARGHRMILLNLTKVRSIDNHGTAALIAACNAAWERRAEVKLTKASAHVQEALDSVLLTAFLDMYDSEEEALQSFKHWLFETRLHSAGIFQGQSGMPPTPPRRRSPRVPLTTVVGVTWESPDGAYLHEQAQTAVISAHGTLLRMQHALPHRQLVELSRAEEAETFANVVYSGLPATDGSTPVALQFAVASDTFWGDALTKGTDSVAPQSHGHRNGSESPARDEPGRISFPNLGELQKLARDSNSAYRFVHSLKSKHPEYRTFTLQELLLKVTDGQPQLVEQFPWLSYPI